MPGFYEEIIRPEKIKVTYLDRDGKKQTLMPEGLLAVVIQHEIDHLRVSSWSTTYQTLKDKE